MYSSKSSPRSFSNHPLLHSLRIKKRARPEISLSSSSSMSSSSNVASASSCSSLPRSMEYKTSSRIFRFSWYAAYSTSSASAYKIRLGEASGEKSSLGTASKNFIGLPPYSTDIRFLFYYCNLFPLTKQDAKSSWPPLQKPRAFIFFVLSDFISGET